MNQPTKKEREYYNLQRERSCERLSITKNNYNWLRRKGDELRSIYVDACNGDVSYDGEYERLTEPLEETICKYVGKLDLFIYFQTDPRGATIYVGVDPIPENNYTTAVCVY